ncbi:MAG: cobalt-precorrin 5A hydrolase [Methanoregulaceae archaeon]|jgi:cobalt-precorrin 5A hydrolase|nr:cobalt-precorrin 5A hydrolase [Methanoregulaceae archaeon]
MTGTVVIAFPRSEAAAGRVAARLDAEVILYREGVFRDVWSRYRRIVALMAAGIVVRQIAPLLAGKWTDPAVVVVSPDLRFAVPLTGGHHGANALARELADLGITPVITTATGVAGKVAVEQVAEESGCIVVNRDSTRAVNAAILEGEVPVFRVPGPGIVIAGPGVSFLIRPGEYAVGVGCRRGVERGEVQEAIGRALADAGITPAEVAVYATTDKKTHEKALIDAVAALSGNLIFLGPEEIGRQESPSPSRAPLIGVKGVAEPCALAVSGRKELVLEKKVYGRVTVAIAR